MRIRKYIKIFIPVAVVLILLIVIISVSGKSPADSGSDCAEGTAFIQSQEGKQPEEVDRILKERLYAEQQARRDEYLEKLESGEISVWSLFQDYVLLGDSRSCGFFFGPFLDRSRVFAEYGAYIDYIDKYIPDMKVINPSYIFLCYGLNDSVNPVWDTPEKYAEVYRERIDSLQEEFPDATIYVNSIFPCIDPAFERWEKWREASEYSAAVQKMCEEAGYHFIANENFDSEMSQYYDDDGIHFTAPFYPLWGKNIIMEVYDSENCIDEDTDS